jgi:endoglucanase
MIFHDANEMEQRAAGASFQVILLRGTDWTGTTGFVPATAEALGNITDVGGSKDLLIFDIQKYLDDGTGQSTECISSYLTQDFGPAAQWLRCHGRQALLVRIYENDKGASCLLTKCLQTEIGGGNTNSCLQYTCPVIDFVNANSDGKQRNILLRNRSMIN